MFVAELDGFCAFDAVPHTICQPSEFIGGRKSPLFAVVRVAHELTVVEHFPGRLIHDCKCLENIVFNFLDASQEAAQTGARLLMSSGHALDMGASGLFIPGYGR